jgi:hypothetical protein
MAVVVALAGCGSGGTATAAAKLTHWRSFAHLKGPVDIAGPGADGSLVVAADRRLLTMQPSGRTAPFPSSYRNPGSEPYIALAPPGCFGPGTVYALNLSRPQGVYAIPPHKKVRVLATLKAAGLANGIAFDTTGRFGGRLLVTVSGGGRTTVYSVGCHGGVRTLTRTAPTVEGGLAVAPPTFGGFSGDLIAPDELTGKIWAITPAGRARLVVTSDLPAGQDTGAESLGFVPGGGGPYRAFMADRVTPGNPHPGDDEILELSGTALAAAGVRSGDLLAATEGGALVDAISCGSHGCSVKKVAAGPKIAHGEGHIAVVPG